MKITRWNRPITYTPSPQKGGTKPHFSTMPIVAKRLCIKMPHMDKEVGLCPSHIVLDGDPALPPKKEAHATGTTPRQFSLILLWPNGRPSQLLPSSLVLTSVSNCYRLNLTTNTISDWLDDRLSCN